MSLPAIVNVTVPVTDTSIRLTNGYVGWSRSPPQLILNDPDRSISVHPTTALGFITCNSSLKMSHSYNLSGPFCHNLETDAIIIEHTSNTQVDIGEYEDSYRNLAGRATISGVGRVTSVAFCDPDCLFLPWNMVLTVEHNYCDPTLHRTTLFNIDYHFEQLTPAIHEWSSYTNGIEMWLYGNLDHKDKLTGHFVVNV
ncbi:hypothetical protein DFH28DRAFT_1084085 [Melampsora americana]|nr:hypothetical protein DFH28DRAFT_1084085 [Melampsora americana]